MCKQKQGLWLSDARFDYLETRQTQIMGIGAAVRLRTKCKKVAHVIDPVNNITQVSCLKVFGGYFTK